MCVWGGGERGARGGSTGRTHKSRCRHGLRRLPKLKMLVCCSERGLSTAACVAKEQACTCAQDAGCARCWGTWLDCAVHPGACGRYGGLGNFLIAESSEAKQAGRSSSSSSSSSSSAGSVSDHERSAGTACMHCALRQQCVQPWRHWARARDSTADLLSPVLTSLRLQLRLLLRLLVLSELSW